MTLYYSLAFLSLAYISYRLIASLIRERRFKAFAKAHGCAAPQDVSGSFPYGVAFMQRVARMKSTGEDFLDDILGEDFATAHTVQKTVFDYTQLISTIEPANLQAVLATQFHDFETGLRRRRIFGPLLGKSIFTSDGSFWEHSRALFRPQFSRENINDLESTNKACTALVAALGAPDADGWTPGAPLQPLLYRFTLDTATDFLFGESVESQTAAINAALGHPPSQGTLPGSTEFVQDMEHANEKMVVRLRLQSLYWLGDGFKFRKATKTIRSFTDTFVRKALNYAAHEKAGEGKQHGLLSTLVSQTKDREELASQTLAIMVAGRDTTAALLGWCWLRLAIHPSIFTKLRTTILKDFSPDTQPTFSQLKSCRYLQHFIQEVLRLHPTVPVNNRFAVRNTTLPLGGGPDGKSPVAIRKGQTVIFSVYLMQRRKDLFGEDAEVFRPERWEQRVPAWHYLPFLGGPRICLGQQFALTEAAFSIVRVMQEFDRVEAVDVGELGRMRKGLGLTMWPADGVRVRFHKAGTSSS